MSNATNQTLLLVEDDAIIALHEASILKNHGFDVKTAHSSSSALDAVHSHKIDLVLMDIDLGRDSADGTETAEKILREKELPIVFLTSHREREMVDRVKGITRYGYVLKSAGEFVLLESIQMAFELFRANLRLKDQERESRAVVENIADAVLRYDHEGRFIFFSRGAERMFGFTAEEVLGKKGTKTINLQLDSDGRDQSTMLVDIFREPEKYAYNENENVRKDGTRIMVAWHNKAVSDDQGNVLFMQCIGRDITEQLKLKRQKDFLLRELNHRVKNNLALINSFINLKETALGSPGILSDIRSQIEAIRIVHEKLYQSEDVDRIIFGEYIEEFLYTVFESFTDRQVNLQIEMCTLAIPPKEAVTFGLIVNEIATNAIKHGFRDDEKARFSVQLERSRNEEEYILSVSNSGNPFPPDVNLNNPGTFGLRIISELVAQLKGHIELLQSPGTTYKISFPR